MMTIFSGVVNKTARIMPLSKKEGPSLSGGTIPPSQQMTFRPSPRPSARKTCQELRGRLSWLYENARRPWMDMTRFHKLVSAFAVLVTVVGLAQASANVQERKPNPALAAMAPQVDGWQQAEAPQSFFPENLYEYIDGAAESYLSYDFRELLVVQLKKGGTPATLTLEIYDMGLPSNAFGIFSAERYPENKAVPVGEVGYLEGESLNFMAGRYYVKLLSFGLSEDTGTALTELGGKVAGAVAERGVLPPLLAAFPKKNLVAQSEKYLKKNFMGYEFLHDGYIATYKVDGRDIECFMAESGSEKEAEAGLGLLLDFFAKDKQVPEKIALGYHVKNRYAEHMYIGRVRNVICGVMRVPEGLESEGEKYLKELADTLAKVTAART
jgi:hypothetical protein